MSNQSIRKELIGEQTLLDQSHHTNQQELNETFSIHSGVRTKRAQLALHPPYHETAAGARGRSGASVPERAAPASPRSPASATTQNRITMGTTASVTEAGKYMYRLKASIVQIPRMTLTMFRIPAFKQQIIQLRSRTVDTNLYMRALLLTNHSNIKLTSQTGTY